MTHASVFSGIGGPEDAATMLDWDVLTGGFPCQPRNGASLFVKHELNELNELKEL